MAARISLRGQFAPIMVTRLEGKIGWVQIGMLGSFEVRTDDGVLADVPGARLRGL
jgi:hypothetical protein